METKEKDLITKYTALAVITMAILVLWSFMKKDYVEFAEYLTATFSAIIMLGVYFFYKEEKNSFSNELSFNRLTEVVPISGKDDNKEYFAVLTLEGFYRYKVIVKIFYKNEKNETVFYGILNVEDMQRYYRIK